MTKASLSFKLSVFGGIMNPIFLGLFLMMISFQVRAKDVILGNVVAIERTFEFSKEACDKNFKNQVNPDDAGDQVQSCEVQEYPKDPSDSLIGASPVLKAGNQYGPESTDCTVRRLEVTVINPSTYKVKLFSYPFPKKILTQEEGLQCMTSMIKELKDQGHKLTVHLHSIRPSTLIRPAR